MGANSQDIYILAIIIPNIMLSIINWQMLREFLSSLTEIFLHHVFNVYYPCDLGQRLVPCYLDTQYSVSPNIYYSNTGILEKLQLILST